MIEWLIKGSIVIAVLGALRLALHHWLLKQLGAPTLYLLWALLPVALIVTAVAALWPVQVVRPEAWFVVLQSQLQLTPPEQLHQSAELFAIWAFGFTVLSIWLVLQAQLPTPRWRIGGLRVIRTASGESPAIAGIFRPTLFIPRDFAQRFAAPQRHLILLHERQHWQRADTLANVFAFLLCAVFWFHPVAWLCYRRFRRDQELACDAQVLATTTPAQRADYSHALLEVAATATTRDVYNPHLYRYGAYNTMKERLQQLVRTQRVRYFPVFCIGLLSLAVVSAWQLPVQAAPTESATPIVRINPSYPAVAAEQGIEGQVLLDFTITAEGKVSDITVVDAQPQGVFEEAAVTALQKWRYHPQHAGSGHQVALAFALEAN